MKFLCFLVVIISGGLALAEDPKPLVISGHVSIGVLTHLRQDANKSGNCMGPIPAWALQEVAALEWALTTINNQSNQEFSVGLQVYDNCGDKDRLTRQSVNLLKNVQQTTNPLIGIISLGDLPSIKTVASLLNAYSLPLTTVQSPNEEILKDQNVFTTAPHMHAQMEAVLSVLRRQRKHSGLLERNRRLGVVSGSHSALQVLESMALKSEIEVHSTILIDTTNKTTLTDDTERFLKSQVGFQGTVILLLHSASINHLIENLDQVLVSRAESFWIFSVLDGKPDESALDLEKISHSFHMSAVVEPFSPLLPGLSSHLSSSLINNKSIISPLTDLVEARKKCPHHNTLRLEGCAENMVFPMLSGTRATSIIKAVSTLVAAFRLVQIDRCPNNVKCPKLFEDEIGKAMVQSMMKLSYNAQETSDNIRYTADGRFVTSYIISRIHGFGLQQVGKYREDTGIVWTHPLPAITPHPPRLDVISPKSTEIKMDNQPSDKSDDFIDFEEYEKGNGIIKELIYSQQDRIGLLYALSVFVWALIGILSAANIGVYIAHKTWDGPIASSQVLESILLLGVTACFLSCILLVLPPTLVTCRLRIVMPPISLSICFGVILLKTMQLRASETLGATGEASKTNVCLTLIFIVGVQVSLSVISQKDLLDEKRSTPVVELDSNGIRMCRRETLPGLIMQEYLLILLVFSKVISLTNRNVTKGCAEGLRLLQVSAFGTVVIVTWMVMTIVSPTCTVLTGTCVICLMLATTILIIIFGPKIIAIRKLAHKCEHTHPLGPSVSNVFKQMENASCVQTLRPPPPFCDPPSLRGHKLHELPPMRPWRLDPYDSPILRHSIPPPPPPPMKDYYYHRSNVFYP